MCRDSENVVKIQPKTSHIISDEEVSFDVDFEVII